MVGVLVAVAWLEPTPISPARAELEALMVPSPLALICTAPLGFFSWAPLAALMLVWALLVIVDWPTTTATPVSASSRQ